MRARSGSVVTGGPTKVDLDGGVGGLDGLREGVVTGPAYGRRKEHEELEVFGDLDGLVGRDVVRWSVEQARAFEQTGGVSEPDGIPVRLDLADCGPAGACAAIKVLKRWRIQEQGLQGLVHGQV